MRRISAAIRKAIESAPTGTAGWVVEPSREDVWGVAAHWVEASSPVFAYGGDGWFPTGRCVADYRHRAWDAFVDWLAAEFREADVLEAILQRAIGFHDQCLDDEE